MHIKDKINRRSVESGEADLWDPLRSYLPAFRSRGLRLITHSMPDYDLIVQLEIDSPPGEISQMRPLDSYAKIAEFRRALAHPFVSETGYAWRGEYFYLYTAGKRKRVYWQDRASGITTCMTLRQWERIGRLFEAAFQHPDYARAWTRLAARHGRG